MLDLVRHAGGQTPRRIATWEHAGPLSGPGDTHPRPCPPQAQADCFSSLHPVQTRSLQVLLSTAAVPDHHWALLGLHVCPLHAPEQFLKLCAEDALQSTFQPVHCVSIAGFTSAILLPPRHLAPSLSPPGGEDPPSAVLTAPTTHIQAGTLQWDRVIFTTGKVHSCPSRQHVTHVCHIGGVHRASSFSGKYSREE